MKGKNTEILLDFRRQLMILYNSKCIRLMFNKSTDTICSCLEHVYK